MSIIEMWLSKVNPTDAGFSLLVWVIVLGAGMFIWKKAFPWFTTDYFPARVKRETAQVDAMNQLEKERIAVQATMRDALIELRVIAGQQLMLLQKQDTVLQSFSGTVLEQQRDTLEQLRGLHGTVVINDATSK